MSPQQIEDMYPNGESDLSVKNYLTDIHCKTPNFYWFLKGLTPPPGRPILSTNGSPTEKISQILICGPFPKSNIPFVTNH